MNKVRERLYMAFCWLGWLALLAYAVIRYG